MSTDSPPAAAVAPHDDVVLGWVHPGTVSAAFDDAKLRSVAWDRATGASRIAGWHAVQCSANVSAGRNELVAQFLGTPAQWLMMIDTDMVWAPDAIHRLLAVADPDRAPIVGGLCFGQEPDTGLIFPTLYDLAGTEAEPEFVRYDTWPQDVLFPVVGTGAAFLLVHRSALEAVRDRRFDAAYPWFQERSMRHMRVGEDVTFCMRAGQCGLPVYVHTGVHIGHIKTHVVTFEAYVAQRAMIDAAHRQEQESKA
jgi:hypothetical protein